MNFRQMPPARRLIDHWFSPAEAQFPANQRANIGITADSERIRGAAGWIRSGFGMNSGCLATASDEFGAVIPREKEKSRPKWAALMFLQSGAEQASAVSR
ncbi:MAG: hypothetical protein P8X77_03155 [Maritimibacter sp.]